MDINTDEGRCPPFPLLHNGTEAPIGCDKTMRLMPKLHGPVGTSGHSRPLESPSLRVPQSADRLTAERRRLLGRALVASAWAAGAPWLPREARAALPGAWDLRWRPLHQGLWMVQAHEGDADEVNRGLVANILLAQDEKGLWLVGSGPSPVAGEALQAAIGSLQSFRLQGRPLALLSPWAHPESVLGTAGLGPHTHWAHTEVAKEMKLRCPGCLQRLAQRMGQAARDLEVTRSGVGVPKQDPIQIPERFLEGGSGRWGPFDWHRRARAGDVTTLVLQHRTSGLAFAPGLLWGHAPPDGRDADTEVLAQNLVDCLDWGRRRAVNRWLGQQGGVVGPQAVQAAAAYWTGLNGAAKEGQERGDDGLQAPRHLAGVPDAWLTHPHHPLNWQRTWRQAESRWLQRNLR